MCGDWKSFKDEKCFKIFSKEEVLNYENAIKSCSQLDSTSTLITISSYEEQEFLANFLFNENKVVDSIWLGAKKSDSNAFKWTDGSNMKFTNWAENNPTTESNTECVEMKSKFSFFGSEKFEGKWANVPCLKKALIVCQKMQNLTLNQLTDLVMNLKKDLEFERKISENNRKESEKAVNELKSSLDNLNKNLFPIGFIYVQLPDQKDPNEIWATMKWTDISTQYANVFFRVFGDKTEAFGKIQDENISMISKIQSKFGNDPSVRNNGHSYYDISCPKSDWSDWIFTGFNEGKNSVMNRFYYSGGEVRPKNMAIRVWKRTL
jgi:hypothetical protein